MMNIWERGSEHIMTLMCKLSGEFQQGIKRR